MACSVRSRRSWLRVVALVALLTVGLVSNVPGQPLPAMAQEDWPLLVVDDAATVNPELVAAPVGDPREVLPPGQTLNVPPGMTVSVAASGLGRPRFMAFDDAGNLLVAAVDEGAILRFPFAEGRLGAREVLMTGLQRPSSVALLMAEGAQYLYVAEVHQVTRYTYDPAGAVGDAEMVIPNLPIEGAHWTRTVAIGPDGMLYLSVGSSCNVCLEAQPVRGAISRANPDGSGFQLFAVGLRNAVGLTFQPESGDLWATVNERDMMGNEIPPDLVTIVREGANYGWPNCVPPDAAPQVEGADCAGVTPPTIGIQAHSAPLGLAFLNGEGVPEDYRGDLIVAQHGSWNRQPPAAPKLLLIDFEDGVPVGARDFATGWQNEAGERWGRPAGVVLAPDGSLIVSDDSTGRLYRISAER
ncbi:MAG: PQQ-dependent sugar dehydrogenase [Thermomicrobiales bacterium]